MRTSQPFQLYSIILLFLSVCTTAWPVWPRWLPELDTLVVRQDSNSGSTTQATVTKTGSAASSTGNTSPGTISSTPDGSATDSTGSGSATGKSTEKSTGKETGSGSDSATSTVHHTTSYDARLPAGGISLMTPAVISGAQYFKIGDFVTFGWNYTDLLATPTAINIMATCTENSQLYTLAMNQTITGNSTGAVTWDTGAYQSTALSNPLLTETYTLIIYDAESSISATAQAGYLAVYDRYTFGMYSPQAYVPLPDYQCSTCSGALGDMERRALGMVLGVSAVTVLSFTWFVSGSGVIW